AELVSSLGAEQILELTLAGDAAAPLGDIQNRIGTLPGVRSLTPRERTLVLSITDMGAALPALLQLLEGEQRAVATLTTHEATLEDVFVKLTGRGLREG